MFILDLFEAQKLQTLVVIPGGFHPFHPGHLSLYRSAQKAFPGATIVYAATDDRKERPFAFADKQKLAYIAGVPSGAFQLVKSPFVAREITQQFDPNTTALVFVRSEKDRDEPPKPGGVKKDGTASYLQPYQQGRVEPMSQHGYMAYLPTVEFDAGPSGVTSATQIRQMWPQANPQQKQEIVTDLYPKNPQAAMQILDKYLGTAVAEAGDTAKGQEKLARVHHRAANRVTSKQADKDPAYARKAQQTQDRAWDRLAVKEQGVAEESTAQDPNVIQMKKRARVAHPFAASDEEALALYISDREIKDVDQLEREQNRERKMIDRIEQGENKLEQEIAHIDAILAQLSNRIK